MSFEDETEELLAHTESVPQQPDSMTSAEVVLEMQRESRRDALECGLPYDPEDDDIPKVRRHG